LSDVAASTAQAARRWDKVELYASYFLLVVLASVIATRLGFDGVWHMPTVDFVLSVVALILTLGSFWFARQSRRWRLAIIAFASATQLVPMVIRQPVLLFPLLGAIVPVAILIGAVAALSRKDTAHRPS
jgi:hypothetical protein